jgi:hypothetical protein
MLGKSSGIFQSPFLSSPKQNQKDRNVESSFLADRKQKFGSLSMKQDKDGFNLKNSPSKLGVAKQGESMEEV